MEFALDESQVALAEVMASFCSDRFPADSLAEREGAAVDRATWAELADLGVFSLLRAEADGGSGLGPVEAALVFEQFGEHLVGGPLLWTVLAASTLGADAASGTGVLAGVGSGELLVGGVDARSVESASALVEHGSEVDVVLVLHDDSVVAHRSEELPTPEVLDPLDPLTPVSRVGGLADGRVVGDVDAARRMRQLGTVLVASMLSGIAARCLEVARSYALEREQFAVPIGSFQAVKHMLADMYVRSTMSQSATYAAAAVLDAPGFDEPGSDQQGAASAAKVVAADAAVRNASTAVQVLGGMGFTWDMAPNYLLKRAWVLSEALGSPEVHAAARGSELLEATT